MSAADFLLSPGMQNVLALVFSEPERGYMLNELLDRAAGGRGNSQRQIERLIAAGVLEEEPRRGRQRSIKANTGFFLYPELRGIAMKSFGLAEPLREALAPFERQIDEAFVFGSVAKTSDTHRSDVDLIVIGRARLMKLTAALAKVEQSLGRPIHLSVYAPDEWANLKQANPALAHIAGDAKIVILPRNGGV